jgi:DNA-binding NarL/FixJ family response regulator
MRVVVADDSVLLREGLVRILQEGDFEVVGSCATRWNSSATASTVSATCSRTASPTWTTPAPPSAASPKEAQPSTAPSSHNSSAATAMTTQSPSSPPREREVLELMAEGRSNHGIASKLVVTEHAVEKHIRSVFQKLRIDSGPDDHRRVLAVLTYLRSTTGT